MSNAVSSHVNIVFVCVRVVCPADDWVENEHLLLIKGFVVEIEKDVRDEMRSPWITLLLYKH